MTMNLLLKCNDLESTEYACHSETLHASQIAIKTVYVQNRETIISVRRSHALSRRFIVIEVSSESN